MDLRKRFAKVNIEITNICNLSCSFCPSIKRSKGFMEVALFRNILKQIGPITDQVCLHLMGDPLIHPKLSELVEICAEFKTPIFFVTNGTLLREKHFDILLHRAFRQINFSLHSFKDNFHDKDPTKYLERIFLFTLRAFDQRPDLYINYRIWNIDNSSGEINNEIIFKNIENKFNISINRNIDPKKKKSFRLKNKLYIHFDSRFTWPSLELPILGTHGTCYGLSSHFGILTDGTVVPCCLDNEGSIPLGNANDQSIIEILDGLRSKKILDGFNKSKLVEDLCKRCQYIERFKN